MKDDATLLRNYAEDRSECDFAELVRRHLNLVYSVALRQVNGDVHLAQDVTQLVFTELARKAGSLANRRVLAGWLFTSTRFAAARLVRGEHRRRDREQEAHAMQELFPQESVSAADWTRLRPVLDDALGELPERHRDAILLRYFEGLAFSEIGRRLSLSENTTRMRVNRALDRLHAQLGRRGVTSSTGALALALANHAMGAAPAGLAATVTGAALSAGGPVAVLTFMSMTKLQLGLAGAIVIAGAGGYVWQEQTQTALREELAGLRQVEIDNRRVAEANRQLGRTAAEVSALRIDDEELVALRDEATALRDRMAAAGRAASRNSRAARGLASAADTLPLSQLDQRPKPIHLSQPVFPRELAREKISGKAVVELVIGSGGEVAEARVVESSRPEFAAPTLEAVRDWKFDPGFKGGRAVNTRVTQEVVFNADDTLVTPGPPLPRYTDWF